jgi:hypothetical protein
VLPAFGGETDIGFKFGAFAQLARFRDELEPYAWRAQLQAEASVQDGATGTEFPYRESNFRIDWPHAIKDRLRVMTELTYLRTTNRGYYGVGNDSHARQLWEGLEEGSDEFVRARRFYQYDGTTPHLRATALVRMGGSWRWFADVSLRWVLINTYVGSLLDHDTSQGAAGGQQLWGTDESLQPVPATGVVFDSRDHETVPRIGHYHEASVRCGPGGFGAQPYCGFNVTLRGYLPLAGEKLSLAARMLGDVVTARAPLLELSGFGGIAGASSLAGARGIRGIPSGRYHGRTKVIGNFEARSFLLPFTVGDQRCSLGLAAFADAGRVWTEPLASVEALDGRGWGIHWGLGAGPRLRWGDALVIRFDVAYSPDGEALGVAPAMYVDVQPVL